MSIDILIIIITLIISYLGYRRGFITSILNLVVVVAFFYFVNDIILFLTNNFSNYSFISDLETNSSYRYIFIGVLSLIVFILSNMIFRRLIRKSFISGLDRLGGFLISLSLAYLLICLVSTSVNYLSLYMEVNEMFNESFFISEQFNEYNLVYRWWFNAQ